MKSYLMYFSKTIPAVLSFFLFVGIILPQKGTAQDSSPSGYFEGSLNFTVEVKGPQASMIKENEPNDKLLMHIKDADYIVQLSGGRYPKTFIFVADSNYEYSMDMTNKRAFRFSSHSDLNKQAKAEEEPEPRAMPTGNTQEINGLTCDEYRMRKAGAQFLFYVHDKYRVNAALFPPKPNAKASFLANGLQGRIPLKTVKRQKGLTVVTTVNKISPREFDKEQFQIPPNFKVKNRDYRY